MDINTVAEIILGVLITISLGLIGWCLTSIVTLGKDLASLHTKVIDHHARDDQRFAAEREDRERDLNAIRAENTVQFVSLKEGITRCEGSITAIHRRIDEIPMGKKA